MNFALFALVIAAAFFVCSLALLNFGRHLGMRYLQRQKGAGSMAGLTTVEGAVFALIGLLLAITISGALQRFDERRQLVIQEANAVSTAYDRLGLLEEVAHNLQMKLRERASILQRVYPAELRHGRAVVIHEQQRWQPWLEAKLIAICAWGPVLLVDNSSMIGT